MKVICKDIVKKDSQESFNLDIMLFLNNKGIDYTSLTAEKQHLALFKVISLCNKCQVFRQGFLPPKYVANPKLVFISRSSTKKDLKYGAILDYTSPHTALIKAICDIWEVPLQDIYFTNTSFCITKCPNDINSTHCKRCYKYKDLELDTINLPEVIFLLGNDAFNSYFNMDCTVNHILGNIYYSYYKGAYRLFIPIPHPAMLLRDQTLTTNILNFVNIIKKSYDNGLMNNIQEAYNACNK